MLKTLSINNDRYHSHKKRRIISQKHSKGLYILPVNNNNINTKGKNPIKIIQRNNTFCPENPSLNNIEPKSTKNNNIIKASNMIKTLPNYNTIDVNRNKKSGKNSKIINRENINIFEIERNLTENENNFRRNVSQNIIKNKKKNDKLINKVGLLEKEINNKYMELTKSKYNYYNVNKNNFKTLYNDRRIRLQNKVNHQTLLDLKSEINSMQDKIEELKNQTNIYMNNYMSIKDEIKNIKNQSKILQESINNIEKEKQYSLNAQIKINSNMNKIKYKLFELEQNKKNIERSLILANKLY
jgi:chromosome segregation ATPase